MFVLFPLMECWQMSYSQQFCNNKHQVYLIKWLPSLEKSWLNHNQPPQSIIKKRPRFLSRDAIYPIRCEPCGELSRINHHLCNIFSVNLLHWWRRRLLHPRVLLHHFSTHPTAWGHLFSSFTNSLTNHITIRLQVHTWTQCRTEALNWLALNSSYS